MLKTFGGQPVNLVNPFTVKKKTINRYPLAL